MKHFTNLFKKEKEGYFVPRTIQDTIPVNVVYEDGIFRVGKDKYSKSFKFTDINYAVASKADKQEMFLSYCEEQ